MKIPRITNGMLLGIVILSLAFFSLVRYPLWHTDVWAHAKYGEAYLKLGFFDHEPLSPFTDHEAPFAHVAWLSQVLYFKLYKFGEIFALSSEGRLASGAEALNLFHFLMMMARFTLTWLMFRRFGGSNAWAAVCLGLYLLASGLGTAIQRPQAFGLFFMTVLLYSLSSPRLSRGWMVGLPLMFGLWANMHGTFVVGLAVLGLHTLGRTIERGFADSETRQLVTVGVLSFLATMVNPHGPALYWHIVAFSGHPNLKTMSEWLPMTFKLEGGTHWPYIMSLVLLAFIWFLGRRKVGAAGWLVALPFALWPWWQERSLLWWWIIAMWLLARLGPGLGERFPTIPSLPEGEPKRWKFFVGAAITAYCLGSLVLERYVPVAPPMERNTVLSKATPWRLAWELLDSKESSHGGWIPELRTEINRQFPDGKFKGVIFSSETQGDFLVWALPPEMPVTLFTHAHVFSKQHWDVCLNVKAGEPDALEILKRFDARLLIVETDTHGKLCQIIRDSEDWIVVVDEIPPPHPPDEFRPERFIAIRK
ncbi:hypothetical protein [Zavarzinella formosa]|uniref:hypothetical protein n=1 Tax=Zavarzinella formosa TaxID=360055 RepID=UPI00031DBBEB|nr:hypothetical protein [Zavarzinella formosa]